jgi:HK97 gp10 family phage protein
MADLDIEIVTNISGLEELEEALTEGSKRAVTKFLRKVEKQAGKILKDALSEEAPYAEGNLSSDIHMESKTEGGALTVRIGPGREGFYGIFQEFGAPEAHVPALHWMELTAKEHQQEVLESYMQALTEGLEDMKKG